MNVVFFLLLFACSSKWGKPIEYHYASKIFTFVYLILYDTNNDYGDVDDNGGYIIEFRHDWYKTYTHNNQNHLTICLCVLCSLNHPQRIESFKYSIDFDCCWFIATRHFSIHIHQLTFIRKYLLNQTHPHLTPQNNLSVLFIQVKYFKQKQVELNVLFIFCYWT